MNSFMNLNNIYKFKSSFLFGGRLFTPDLLEIDDTFVTLRKKDHMFSSMHTKSIPLKNIINIKVTRSGYGASILIESFSKSSIFGKGFSSSNAMKIKRIILG
jgi:hypothetical protein